ncbi:MAG: hypothetical protein KDK70_43205, partial [Myxococcales bacterium]|nr:hypothetical protein [Myxococcales bacterium]
GAFRGAHAVGIVVTCRTRAYEALGRRLACGAAVELEPPNDAEAARMLAGPSSRGSSLREAAPTLPDTLPRSPLLLALLREVGPPPSGTGPTAAVYDAYVDRALARPPQLAPDLRRARRAQLAWLAANLRRLGSRELWLEHLQADWLPGAGRRLAARALGALTIASLLLGVDLAAAHLAGRTPDVGWMIWGVSVIMVFVLNGGLQVRPMQALTWSARRSLAKVPVLAAFAVVFAAIFAAIHPFLPNLILDACACAVLAVLLGLEPSVEPSSLRPGEGLRQSLINSLAIGPVAAVLAGGAVGYLGVPLAIPYCPPDSPL